LEAIAYGIGLIEGLQYFAKFFERHQLEKIFFLFPDPHFKKSTHRRRVISPALLSEYAFAVRPGGLAYNCTDVLDLHEWTVAHFDAHPLWERIADEELVSLVQQFVETVVLTAGYEIILDQRPYDRLHSSN
jgi:tRNA G46 methylase TrmB